MMWEIKNRANLNGAPVKNQAEKPENADTLDIYVYSDVDKKWWDEDDCVGANEFRELLSANPSADVNVYINSYGGSVSEGVAIYNQLRRHAGTVTAYIDGFACSIASVIPMAADKVVMSDVSAMMIHNPWTFAAGNAEDMRRCADSLDTILDGCIIPAYMNKVKDKITEEELREMLNAEKWLTPAKCLECGLVDEVATGSVDEEEAKAKYNEYINAAKAHFMDQFKPFKASEEPVTEEETPETENHPEEAAPEQEDKEVAEPEAPQENPAPEPEEPAEDKEAQAKKTHEYFMKLLKGEIK